MQSSHKRLPRRCSAGGRAVVKDKGGSGSDRSVATSGRIASTPSSWLLRSAQKEPFDPRKGSIRSRTHRRFVKAPEGVRHNYERVAGHTVQFCQGGRRRRERLGHDGDGGDPLPPKGDG